jgi:hypothetical protein
VRVSAEIVHRIHERRVKDALATGGQADPTRRHIAAEKDLIADLRRQLALRVLPERGIRGTLPAGGAQGREGPPAGGARPGPAGGHIEEGYRSVVEALPAEEHFGTIYDRAKEVLRGVVEGLWSPLA